MVQKKQTNIRADFFPRREQYATTDADAAADADGPATVAPSVDDGPLNPKFRPEIQRDVDAGRIILVDWDGPDDPENPRNWSLSKKWTNTGLLCVMCLFIGLATAAYGSGVSRMCEELNARTSCSFPVQCVPPEKTKDKTNTHTQTAPPDFLFGHLSQLSNWAAWDSQFLMWLLRWYVLTPCAASIIGHVADCSCILLLADPAYPRPRV